MSRPDEMAKYNRNFILQAEEKLAGDLALTSKELQFKKGKSNLAAELINAAKELLFQKGEKGKLAAELTIANKELVFQNGEKEKLAADLVKANKELVFQNQLKEKRSEELEIANRELVLQAGLQSHQAKELEEAIRELESFSYSVSHDLRAPLRAINGFTEVLAEDYIEQFDDDAKELLSEIISNSNKMGELIDNLLEFSRVGKQQISVGGGKYESTHNVCHN